MFFFKTGSFQIGSTASPHLFIFLKRTKSRRPHPFPFYIYIFVFYFLFLIEMYCKFIICHSSHYMLWRTRSTTAIVQKGNTETHTQGSQWETLSWAHCTYNSEWNTLALVLFRVSSLFSIMLFFSFRFIQWKLRNLFFSVSSFPFPIGNSLLRFSSYRSSPNIFLHGSQHTPSRQKFFFFDIISFYKHDMFRNSTQTNVLVCFFCQNTTFFFSFFT